MTRQSTSRLDLYQSVSDAIVKQLEAGVRPWQIEWNAAPGTGALPIRQCGTPYRGINILILWMAQQEFGYVSNRWVTYRQAAAIGAQVRKGERGQRVVYVGQIARESETDNSDQLDNPQTLTYLRQYTVFNVAQIDNPPADWLPSPATTSPGSNPEIPNAVDAQLLRCATVHHGGGAAFYQPSTDSIRLPSFEDFHSADSYTSTLAHELIHWTGAPNRLNRSFPESDPRRAYALEELVAELGAAFVCAALGVSDTPRPDHARYLDHYLKALRDDARAIFRVASRAQSAAEYVLDRVTPMDSSSDSPYPGS